LILSCNKLLTQMKEGDILRLLVKSMPDIERDIQIARTLIRDKKYKHAAEKHRDVARKFIMLDRLQFAVDQYNIASNFFIKAECYEKAINSEISICNIYRLTNNTLGLADAHEKIASFYKHYLNNFSKAGVYYLSSAKHYENEQNYRAAFKKAQFATECFEESKERGKRIDSHSLAFRMALQSGYLEKAGEHALRWISLLKRDYSADYLSVCFKGFRTFQRTDRHEDALKFLNAIIRAHYVAKVPQENIVNYLIEQQKLSMRVHKRIDMQCNHRFLSELGSDLTKIINYSIELCRTAEDFGLEKASDTFYVQQREYERAAFKIQSQYSKYVGYWLWKTTSMYGTSLSRWLFLSLVITTFFGFCYANYPCPSFMPDMIENLLTAIKPEIKVTSLNNFFSPYYYSIVSFTTLGYGDIMPANLSAQIFFVIEVFTGYMMLGCLLTVFSKKLLR
jgi:tetratricopeptide (TPR) repeat protein